MSKSGLFRLPAAPRAPKLARLASALLTALALTVAGLAWLWPHPAPTFAQQPPGDPAATRGAVITKPLSFPTFDEFQQHLAETGQSIEPYLAANPQTFERYQTTAAAAGAWDVLNPIPDWFSDRGLPSWDIAWGDVDNDGDLDLAVANAPSWYNGVEYVPGYNEVYLNEEGVLQTTPAWQSREDDKTRSLTWGDVDGDGDLDLAAANSGSNRVYLNQGGTLQTSAYWSSANSDYTYGIALGDMDGDGDLDLVAGNWNAPDLIYLNDGAGNFYSSVVQYTELWQHGMPTAGPGAAHSAPYAWGTNLSGDYSAFYSGSLTSPDIDLSGYAGAPALSWWQWLDTEYWYDYAYVEVSKDGGSNWTVVYSDTGNVDFSWTPYTVTLNSSYNVSNFRVRFRLDINAPFINDDGFYIDDVSISVGGTPAYAADFDVDDGGYLASAPPALPGTVRYIDSAFNDTREIALADADGDGDLDVAAGVQNGANRLYRNNGGASSFTTIWTDGSVDDTWAVAWGDVNADGNPDLAVGNRYQANKLYLNTGATLQSTPVWSDSLSDGTRTLAWGDVDGDGDMDLATGNEETTSSRGAPNKIFLNTGSTLEISATWESDDLDVTYGIAFADVNGDGDLDLGVGNWFSPNKVYPNKGGSLETDAVWFSNRSDRTWAAAWGDMDGDGDLDLAAANAYDPSGVYLNSGGALQQTFVWTAAGVYATIGAAWGDMNGDGILDLALGSQFAPNVVYLGNGTTLQSTPVWTDSLSDVTWAVAWGDVDNDGDLDLAVANSRYYDGGCSCYRIDPNRLYLNNGGLLEATASQTFGHDRMSLDLAWGDMDGDGDLDLAVGNFGQPNEVYLNEGGVLQLAWMSDEGDDTQSIAWGDVDGDGDLDLAVGNGAFPASTQNKIYYNVDGMLQTTAGWLSHDSNTTLRVAWGDVDGDGDLDLAAANQYAANKIYFNEGGVLQPIAGWLSNDSDSSRGIAWGDVDSDGDLDLAAANDGEQNKLYRNEPPAELLAPYQSAFAAIHLHSDAVPTFNQPTTFLAPADYYAVPGIRQSGVIPITFTLYHPTGLPAGSVQGFYSPDGGGRWYRAVPDAGSITTNLGVGTHVYQWNVLNSGFFGQSDNVAFRLEAYPDLRPQTNGVAGPYQRPFVAAQTFPFRVRGSQVRVFSATTPVSNSVVYRLRTGQDAGGEAFKRGNGQPFRTDELGYLRGRGQIEVGDRLLALLPASQTTCDIYDSDDIPRPIPADSAATVNSYLNVPHSGLVLDVNVVSLSGTHTWVGDLSFILQSPAGTEVELMPPSCGSLDDFNLNLDDEAAPGSWPCPPTDGGTYQPGNPLNAFDGENSAGIWTLKLYDSFPADGGSLDSWGLEICATGLPLYYTNGAPVVDGLNTYTVNTLGVQNLSVSTANPLLLFDLAVSLEWDAHRDAGYLEQLAFDLKQTSRYLYDFTNGQVALGDVSVTQNGDDWAFSHVVVHATNRLRPFAVQGGIVVTPTVDPQHADIVYGPGQVHIGATWNRYGTPGQNLGIDWPLVLAHELGHFLLFLDDTYLGLDSGGLLVPVGTCLGSAMGDVYNIYNTEFIADTPYWNANCGNTLAAQTLGRTEWETIRLWYPWLNAPPPANDGPGLMPYNLTTVTIFDPLTPTDTLTDPTFYLDYQGGAVSSSEGRAYLLRNADANPADYEYLVDLGSPVGGQNRVKARGARPGDRLCVFDRPRKQYGCEVIEASDDRLALEENQGWTPLVQLSPVTSKTFNINVAAISGSLSLRARLFPELGYGSQPITLTEVGGIYSGTFLLNFPSLAGHIQVWVNETATEANPRRETIVAYSVGGNPGSFRGGGGSFRGGGGSFRGGGGSFRGGGGSFRGGGGSFRGGGAPLVSPDGQMIFFTENPIIFDEGDFYTVQNMAGLPPLPTGKTPIGQGYSLVASPGAPVITGSVSFQYLGSDALTEGVDESQLALHFWDGSGWRVVATSVSTYYNLASGPSQGAGVYALLAGTTVPEITGLSPASATNNAPTTLNISGGYFLPPLEVALVGPTATFTLTPQSVSTDSITALVPAGLPAAEYQVTVVGLDQPGGPVESSTPATFALYNPANACFYDFFESGSGQWELGGQWAIATLPGGEQAITDSPDGNYNSAASPALTQTTYITSTPFSLSGCSLPLLTFRHDYAIASISGSQDVAQVEISTDGGASWTVLKRYTGGGVYGNWVLNKGADGSAEWANVNWRTAEIGLSAYTGTVRLRFGLVVDRNVADKGWVLDEVQVVAGTVRTADLQLSITGSPGGPIFGGLPVVYTLVVTNAGPDALDALVSGLFPSQAVAGAGSSAACWADGTVQCALDDLAAAQTITVKLFTSQLYSGTLTMTAAITPTYPYAIEPNLGNNQRSHYIQVIRPAGIIYLPLIRK